MSFLSVKSGIVLVVILFVSVCILVIVSCIFKFCVLCFLTPHLCGECYFFSLSSLKFPVKLGYFVCYSCSFVDNHFFLLFQ